MAMAYTPGLIVTEKHLVKKKRILPLKGETLVTIGQRVKPGDVVARTLLPGPVESVNVANKLGVPPEDIAHAMKKQVGDKVQKGELIAQTKTLWIFTTDCVSPMSGTIESISPVTGQVLVRGAPQPVEVKAYIHGEVIELFPKEGVTVASWASLAQGIFGIGPETNGVVRMAVNLRTEELTEDRITADMAGQVIVGGARVTASAVKKAIQLKVAGIVTGGFDDTDLRDLLGYDLGVAITGNEEIGVTMIVTEGFGSISMAQRTFDLLKSKVGKLACINGATQIRAGVIRPEVVIPEIGSILSADTKRAYEQTGMDKGSLLRVIRHPYFGKIGKVVALPAPLMVLESGSKARVVEVQFEDGAVAVVPRANVELIES